MGLFRDPTKLELVNYRFTNELSTFRYESVGLLVLVVGEELVLSENIRLSGIPREGLYCFGRKTGGLFDGHDYLEKSEIENSYVMSPMEGARG
ncbi:hypothetical protein Tco_0606563 [Tanacetum coccineum]